MKSLIAISSIVLFVGCSSALRKPMPETFNQRQLKAQQALVAAGKDPYGRNTGVPSGDPTESSLWAKSVGSPYIIRNQKAQKVGDLSTVIVDEEATASTKAKTGAKKESDLSVTGTLGFGQAASEQVGTLSGTAGNTSEFKGEGTTDRSGRLQTTVQAVVEDVLPNGTLFVRGAKVVTINEEDQVIELSGFVRPDDIRINNTVSSSLLADAEVRYVGAGVISEKNRVGWGMRVLDWIWPF